MSDESQILASMRFRLVLSIALLVQLTVANTSSAASLYTVTDLGTFGGTASQAASINNIGQIVGLAEIANNSRLDAFEYSNGTLTDLSPGVGGYAVAINDSGSVLGKDGGNTSIFANGTITDLTISGGGIPGIYDSPQAMNNSGQVVGWAATSSAYRAYLYQNGVTTNLGSLGSDSYAYGINNAGQIVGYYYNNSGNLEGFIWQNGHNTSLPAFAQASGINDSGQIIGSESTSNFAGIDTNGSMVTLNELGIYSQAFGINNAGAVVGYWSNTGDQTSGRNAFLYAGGVMSDLNTLTTGSAWTLQEANGINNAGDIVGYGINPAGNQDAFLLTPVSVPEPAAAVMMVTIGLLMGRRRFR
jgi:probable HAF family extracellular repeat protein